MIDLKKFRTENNISQKEICKVLDLAQPYVSAIENGKRPLGKEKIESLYNHYGDIILKYKTPDVVIGHEGIDHDDQNVTVSREAWDLIKLQIQTINNQQSTIQSQQQTIQHLTKNDIAGDAGTANAS